MAQFSHALKESRASVPPEMEEEYEKMVETLKRKRPRGRQMGFLAALQE